ncbi:MAG: hypothetical protein CML24_01715 [Rhizobiales bacterium]|nr:hypothetical protein [Hyphomicrobiales bacterium]
MDAQNPDHYPARHDADEISLGDLIRGVWQSRGWAAIGGIAGLTLAGGALAFQILSTPSISSFRQDIALRIDDASYPNGVPFSTNDLRSPIVLQRVHDQIGLEAFGLTVNDFAAGVSITPTSETYDGVISRYRGRLANTELTYTERQQIEAEFSEALAASLAAGARIEFTLPVGTTIPDAVGRSVVNAIPNVWAEIYINQLGVLDLPIPGSSAELINADFLASLDYPMAHDALERALDTLLQRIDTAMLLGGAQNLRADATGRTLFDVRRDVSQIERYSLEHVLAPLTELGLNKSPDVTTAAYRYQVDELSRQIELAEENAAVIDAALNTRGSASGSVTTAAVDNRALGIPDIAPQYSVVQQFGPELVERLVTMSIENASVDFRETLINSKLEFERQALELSSQRAMYEQRLALLSGDLEIDNQSALAEIFNAESTRVANELNGAWNDVEQILAHANLERISHDKELFRFLPTRNQIGQSASLINQRAIVLLIAAAIGGMMVGMIGFLISRNVGNRSA